MTLNSKSTKPKTERPSSPGAPEQEKPEKVDKVDKVDKEPVDDAASDSGKDRTYTPEEMDEAKADMKLSANEQELKHAKTLTTFLDTEMTDVEKKEKLDKPIDRFPMGPVLDEAFFSAKAAYGELEAANDYNAKHTRQNNGRVNRKAAALERKIGLYIKAGEAQRKAHLHKLRNPKEGAVITPREKTINNTLRDTELQKQAKTLASNEIYEETKGKTISEEEETLLLTVRAAQIFARLLTEKVKSSAEAKANIAAIEA